MSNMTVNQRNQYDRATYSAPTGVGVRSPRRMIILNVILGLIAAALVAGTIVTIDGWAQGVVLAMIVVTTIGAMIALSPNRRA
jgi:hypothetical protein